MADLPEGAELVRDQGLVLSVVLVRNVYVLPGVPAFFQAKFRVIRERFRRAPFHLRRVYLSLDEGEIAALLDETERRFGVAVGSYPRFDGADHKVLVTIESKEAGRVDAALAHLEAGLAKGGILRTESA